MSVGIVTPGSWVISFSKQVRQRIDRMGHAALTPDGIQQTYDFSTFFPNVDLGQLESQMEKLIELVFAYTKQNESPVTKDKVLVVKNRKKATWNEAESAPNETASCKLVTKDRLMTWIKHLLANLHVKLGDKVYRQTKGVPMGTSCSPFLANLLLFSYEFEYMTTIISTRSAARSPGSAAHKLLKKLSFCTRYIDDLWNPLVSNSRK